MNNNELMHYGVLGMKWGVRKDRRSSSSKRKKKTVKTSDDYKEYSNLRKRDVRTLSNNELRKVNDRMNLEQNYRRLNPSTISKGLKIATATAAALGTMATLYDNYGRVVTIGKKLLNR